MCLLACLLAWLLLPAVALAQGQLAYVQHWQKGALLQVVLTVELPAQTKFTHRHGALPAQAGRPHRVYVDLVSVQAHARLKASQAARVFPLQAIRLGQPTADTTRLVLDLAEERPYRISVLQKGQRRTLLLELELRQDDQGGRPLMGSAGSASKPTPKPTPKDASVGAVDASVGAAEAAAQVTHTPAQRSATLIAPPPTPSSKDDAAHTAHPVHPAAASASTSVRRMPAWHEALGLQIRTVVLDPGHGGHDPGAVGIGPLPEKTLALDICQRLKRIFAARAPQLRVVLTRHDDRFIPLAERPSIARREGADLFVSVHLNAHSRDAVHGVETYYLDVTRDPQAMQLAARENALSNKGLGELNTIFKRLAKTLNADHAAELATVVQREMTGHLTQSKHPARDLGVKQAPFLVLVGASMPAILIEAGFLSHPREGRLLQRADYRERIAEGIFQGLTNYVAKLQTPERKLAQGRGSS